MCILRELDSKEALALMSRATLMLSQTKLIWAKAMLMLELALELELELQPERSQANLS